MRPQLSLVHVLHDASPWHARAGQSTRFPGISSASAWRRPGTAAPPA